MTGDAVVRLVCDLQAGRTTEAQRVALGDLLLKVHIAVHFDADPEDPWAPVAAALRDLTSPVVRRSNVVPLRPCSGRRSR